MCNVINVKIWELKESFIVMAATTVTVDNPGWFSDFISPYNFRELRKLPISSDCFSCLINPQMYHIYIDTK